MDIIIRAVREEDAEQIYAMRLQPGFENMLAVPSERAAQIREHLKNMGPDQHSFVAVAREEGGERVVGFAGLTVNASPRCRHSAGIGIVVREDWRGMGVGSRLMEALLDMADNWLMLVRVELGVYPDNERAIRLYRKFGFEAEGTKRKAVIRGGRYVDEVVMARIREMRGD